MKRVHQSRTIWFSSLVMIIGGLEMFFPRLEGWLDSKYYAPAFFLIGMIGVILRIYTKEPIQ